MKLKKIVSMLMVSAMLATAVPVQVSAQELNSSFEDTQISPRYEIANSVSSTLSFTGTTANCVSSASGRNTVSIYAEQTLEKYWGLWVWNAVNDDPWTKEVSSSKISMSNHAYNLESGKYRLKTEVTLTNADGETETITVYSAEKSF